MPLKKRLQEVCEPVLLATADNWSVNQVFDHYKNKLNLKIQPRVDRPAPNPAELSEN